MDSGTTAWILISSALVLFMTPGLAFFYGGMVRSKNVLAMLMKNYIAMGVVTITWVIVGCSLAFSSGNVALGDWGLFGNLDLLGLTTLDLTNSYFGNDVPDLLHVTLYNLHSVTGCNQLLPTYRRPSTGTETDECLSCRMEFLWGLVTTL